MAGLDEIVNGALRRLLRTPPRNVWPAVPDPHPRVEALYHTVAALKQGYEQLSRNRGNRRYSAVVLGELDDFAQHLQDTMVEWVEPPERSNSAGSPGQVAAGGGYLYVCISTNIWRRVELLEW